MSRIKGAALLYALSKEKKLYVAQNTDCSLDQIFHCFSIDGILEYKPLLDEFGPLKLSSAIRFT